MPRVFLKIHKASINLIMYALYNITHSAAMDSMGKNMEVTQYAEKLVPSTRFVAVDNVAPTVSDQCFVAPSASLVGNVTVGKNSR